MALPPFVLRPQVDDSDDEAPPATYEISAVEEMPEGAVESDDHDDVCAAPVVIRACSHSYTHAPIAGHG